MNKTADACGFILCSNLALTHFERKWAQEIQCAFVFVFLLVVKLLSSGVVSLTSPPGQMCIFQGS